MDDMFQDFTSDVLALPDLLVIPEDLDPGIYESTEKDICGSLTGVGPSEV